MKSAAAGTVLARNVAAGKGPANAFEELCFALAEGEITALAGPNGAGKSTLLDAILGLVPLRAGELHVLGEKPGHRRRAIGYVPQRSELPHDAQLSGYEFVAAAYRCNRWGVSLHPRQARQAVEHALDQVDASSLARQRLASLSGGQRQRLLIAQALVNDPKLLLLDEPLAQLDPAAQAQIAGLVSRLCRERLLTVLLSTHDLNPLLPVTDQVLYLAGGRGRIGTVDDVVTDAVLSNLYGVSMHVLRNQGHVFVVQAGSGPSIRSIQDPVLPRQAHRHAC